MLLYLASRLLPGCGSPAPQGDDAAIPSQRFEMQAVFGAMGHIDAWNKQCSRTVLLDTREESSLTSACISY